MRVLKWISIEAGVEPQILYGLSLLNLVLLEKGSPTEYSSQGLLGCLRVAGTPRILWNLSKFLMIIHICEFDLQLLMSWLKTLPGIATRPLESISMFLLAVRARSSCCTMAGTAAMKGLHKRT